tara:strand:+ start:185 stop:1435 length:1251 start_codon:yes stop_codon:yes gene_type:complete
MSKYLIGAAIGFAVGALWVSRRLIETKNKETLLKKDTCMYIGIDLGGTTLSVALVNSNGTKVSSSSSNISNHAISATSPNQKNDSRSFNNVLNLMTKLVNQAIQNANDQRENENECPINIDNITAIGIGAPGLLDTTKGIILAIANFEWENVHITDTLAKSLQINPSKVFLENDANSALLAELWIGAGKNKQNVVMLTLGTGVGCAIMSDGHLLRGHNGDAGEMGHTILIPNGRSHGSTGVHGIFEGYASATAVVARVKEQLKSCKQPSPLRSIERTGTLTCADIFRHATLNSVTNFFDGNNSDSTSSTSDSDLNTGNVVLCNIAKNIVMETIEYVGIGCINVCRCFDPEIVILTGGMTRAGDPFLNGIRDSFCKHHWNITASKKNRIVLAKCGSDAGTIGAAAAALLRQGGSLNL